MTTDFTTITDEYLQCETGFADLVRSNLSAYFLSPDQVSSDDTVISMGADYFLVYRPGSFPNQPFARGSGVYDFSWRITCDLYVRYQTYKTSWDKFKTIRGELIRLVKNDKTLGGAPNVWQTDVESEEDAVYFKFDTKPKQIRPNFIIQTFRVIAVQRIFFE